MAARVSPFRGVAREPSWPRPSDALRLCPKAAAPTAILFRQLPHPKTEERRDHGQGRADPDWNRLTAESYLGLRKETDKMTERYNCENQ